MSEKNTKTELEQARRVSVIEAFQEFDLIDLADFMKSSGMTEEDINQALRNGGNTVFVNAVENFLTIDNDYKNGAPLIEEDFVMIAGYSIGDAKKATQRVLEYDEEN